MALTSTAKTQVSIQQLLVQLAALFAAIFHSLPAGHNARRVFATWILNPRDGGTWGGLGERDWRVLFARLRSDKAFFTAHLLGVLGNLAGVNLDGIAGEGLDVRTSSLCETFGGVMADLMGRDDCPGELYDAFTTLIVNLSNEAQDDNSDVPMARHVVPVLPSKTGQQSKRSEQAAIMTREDQLQHLIS